jgi:hypothetical protein
MSEGFGIEPPRPHAHSPHRPPAKYLVVIDVGGSSTARLFLESRALVSEFDAGSEEVSLMTRGLVPAKGADGVVWDEALGGSSPSERAAADVYTLDV